MKNYLALHIDFDFLAGTVCADENNLSYPIKNGNDDFLWLYFYNDPYSNIVSFGKENQKHCSEGKTNYYGNFIELIESDNNTFSIGEYEYPIIELLRYSKIIDKLKNEFSTRTLESQDNIPTLLTFSLSIGELAKQKLVDYLKRQGFNIVSYTIPLAELSCYYALKNSNVNYANGNSVTFLEASNSNLHLLKLMFTADYFILDGKPETKQGLGIDPRKRALLKFVINKIGTMGILTEQEKETEYKIMEPKTDEWLNRLDMQTGNAPVDINESLSKMPNAKRRVLIYKDRIAEFTNSDIKLILDTYHDYVKRNISQDVSAIILLGNCFQNDIIKSKFQNLIPQDRLYVFANKDIQNILSVYPKIDFKRYIDQEARIKALAQAEEQKKAEQRALEDKIRKEQEAEEKRFAEEKKAEENRKEAQKRYRRAMESDKENKLQDALANIENAISLDHENVEYKHLADTLKKKIKDLSDKTEKYKSWLKDAESYEQSGDLNNALKAYKYAQDVFDSSELRKKIVETETKIEQQTNETKINGFISIAVALSEKGKWEDAINNINKALEIDPANKTAKETLHNIYTQQHHREEDLIRQKEMREKAEKIVAEADSLFANENWETAKSKYEEAEKLFPNDETLQSKIKQCVEKIKAKKDEFDEFVFNANIAEKKGNLSEALNLLEQALKIKYDDEIKSKIKKLHFKIEFAQEAVSESSKKKVNIGNNGFPNLKTNKVENDDFLNLKTGKAENDNFLNLKTGKAENNGDDDFLNVKKKNKNDFSNSKYIV
jgi:tetratricopeptide (TPR) repeat protein